MFKRLMALAVLAALCLASIGAAAEQDLLEDMRSRGNIVIATEGEWSPWTYHDEQDVLVGFDVEVAEAIAAKLGLQPVFRECPFSSIFLGIDDKMYDIAANSVEIIPDRAEKYNFSIPYAYLRTALIVRGDNEDIHSFSDVAGKVTANSAGSTYALIAEEYGAEIQTVNTLAQTLDLVLAKRVNATFNAELSFYDYMKEHPEANLKVAALSEEASEVAIPVRKGPENEAFLEALNQAIEELRAEGVLKSISEKYFGVDITEPAG